MARKQKHKATAAALGEPQGIRLPRQVVEYIASLEDRVALAEEQIDEFALESVSALSRLAGKIPVDELLFATAVGSILGGANWAWQVRPMAHEGDYWIAGAVIGVSAWGCLKARNFALDCVDRIAHHTARVMRSRYLAQAIAEREATKRDELATERTIERRRMHEIAARQEDAADRAIDRGRLRRESEREAKRLHQAETDLRGWLRSVYTDPGRSFTGARPFSKNRLGSARYQMLREAGAITGKENSPQWSWSFAADPDAAFDRIVELCPTYLTTEG